MSVFTAAVLDAYSFFVQFCVLVLLFCLYDIVRLKDTCTDPSTLSVCVFKLARPRARSMLWGLIRAYGRVYLIALTAQVVLKVQMAFFNHRYIRATLKATPSNGDDMMCDCSVSRELSQFLPRGTSPMFLAVYLSPMYACIGWFLMEPFGFYFMPFEFYFMLGVVYLLARQPFFCTRLFLHTCFPKRVARMAALFLTDYTEDEIWRLSKLTGKAVLAPEKAPMTEDKSAAEATPHTDDATKAKPVWKEVASYGPVLTSASSPRTTHTTAPDTAASDTAASDRLNDAALNDDVISAVNRNPDNAEIPGPGTDPGESPGGPEPTCVGVAMDENTKKNV